MSGVHEDAVELLVSRMETPEAKKAAQHLSWILAKKNLVEYEARLFTVREARFAKHGLVAIEIVDAGPLARASVR